MRIELEFGKVGFWREGKTGTPREKTYRQRREPTTNLSFYIPEARKRYPFRSEPPHKGGGREARALTTASPLRSFRQKPIQLLYLHQKVSSFMSISLIHNKYFAKFVLVHFLIQEIENVTLGLMFAVCRERDSKSLDFPFNDWNP